MCSHMKANFISQHVCAISHRRYFTSRKRHFIINQPRRISRRILFGSYFHNFPIYITYINDTAKQTSNLFAQSFIAYFFSKEASRLFILDFLGSYMV